MKILNITKNRSVLITSALLLVSLNSPAFACTKTTNEYSNLSADWAKYCEQKSGWGETGLESFCFSTWQHMQVLKSDDDLCISERIDDAIRLEKGKA